MKTTILAALILFALLNSILFVTSKLFDLVEPFLFKFFAKYIAKTPDVPSFTEMLKDPEYKERDKVRNKYKYLFWNMWFIFWYAITPLTGIHFYVAFIGVVVLYILGGAEAKAVAHISAQYREKEYLDLLAAQDNAVLEHFISELKKQIEAAQGKKDVERN